MTNTSEKHTLVYVGSKNRISKYLIPILTKHLTEDRYYVEPFCGGCNMIKRIKHTKKIANDSNEYLIELLKHKQEYIEEFEYMPEISKETWLKVKQNPDQYDKWFVGFIGFVCSFRGLFMSSYCGNHIIKIRTGEFEDYQNEHVRNFIKDDLSDIEFHCEEYQNLNIPDHSIIYCDPPYKDTVGYSKKETFDSEGFWEWCRNKVNEGHIVYVSEYNAPSDFIPVWEMQQTKNFGTKKQITVEKLFVQRSQVDQI